eukprot:TRINITY_DN1994_c1_g1_i2.p1 TRINITY_DN1994_c1_g1~~TRINITY_DN1994_c1_g1_i2.p1  ORF type:complete len:266 (-),score=41.96 TRINITY_DN1994_c1_g1_i2:38-835(-)
MHAAALGGATPLATAAVAGLGGVGGGGGSSGVGGAIGGGVSKTQVVVGLVSAAVMGLFVFSSLNRDATEQQTLASVRDMRKNKALLRRITADEMYVQGKHAKAVLFYTKALNLDRANVHVLFMRAMTRYELGEWEHCAHDCVRTLNLAEDRNGRAYVTARIYKMVGKFLAKMGHIDSAIDAFHRSLAYKDSRFVQADLRALQNTGRLEVVSDEEGEALETTPSLPCNHVRVGDTNTGQACEPGEAQALNQEEDIHNAWLRDYNSK